jgi:CheY-like chemotaxis protein
MRCVPAPARRALSNERQDMRRYVSGLLAKYCDVTQCTDGQCAWDELRGMDNEYDLVLSDDMMPVRLLLARTPPAMLTPASP